MRWLVGEDLRASEGPELEDSYRWAGPVRRCWTETADFWSLSRAPLEKPGGIPLHPPLFHTDSFTAFGGKHQHPLYHLVSGFPFRRIKGGVCSFVGQPQPAWAFINVSRTTLEKRLLWAVVKDHSKPLAGGQEKQSDGCSCSMSLPLIISLAFPWLD